MGTHPELTTPIGENGGNGTGEPPESYGLMDRSISKMGPVTGAKPRWAKAWGNELEHTTEAAVQKG